MAVLFGIAAGLAAPPCRADFEVELESGGILVARSLRRQGESVVLFRESGQVEIDAGSIRGIRERPDEPSVPVLGSAPAVPPAAPKSQSEPPAAVSDTELAAPLPKDPAEAERVLARQEVLLFRDLHFAKNRGDDAKSIGKQRAKFERVRDLRRDVLKRLAY